MGTNAELPRFMEHNPDLTTPGAFRQRYEQWQQIRQAEDVLGMDAAPLLDDNGAITGIRFSIGDQRHPTNIDANFSRGEVTVFDPLRDPNEKLISSITSVSIESGQVIFRAASTYVSVSPSAVSVGFLE